MKIKEIYEIYSLIVGLAATGIILYFLLINRLNHCIILLEPIWWIRIPEIIMGISVIPYYLNKIYGGKK